jgi:hypothetical protein
MPATAGGGLDEFDFGRGVEIDGVAFVCVDVDFQLDAVACTERIKKYLFRSTTMSIIPSRCMPLQRNQTN